MAIRLFLKHLFATIKRRPLQPLLLTIVIAVSVAISIVAIDTKAYMEEDLSNSTKEESGCADLVVKPSGLAESRFLFASDIREKLGEGVTVTGTYGLPFYEGDKMVDAVGVDFFSITDIFSLGFENDLVIREEDVPFSVFVSKEYAEKNGLEVGSNVSFVLFGQELNYVVRAISTKNFLNSYDIMVDVRSLTEDAFDSYFFLSGLKTDFIPSNTIYIQSGEKDPETLKRELLRVVPNCTVTTIAEKQEDASFFISLISYVVILLTYIFALAVIYCCFYILSEQRREENALFSGVGAKPINLMLLSSLEMIIYWVLGTVIGVFVSIPIVEYMVENAEYAFVTVRVHENSVAISAGFALIASQLAFWLFNIIDRRKKKKHVSKVKKQTSGLSCLILLLLSIGSAVASALLHEEIKFYVSIVALLLSLIMVFFVGKYIFEKMSHFLGKKRMKNTKFLYATKNCGRISALSNTSALLTIFFSAIIILVSILIMMIDVKSTLDEMVVGDYLVANITKDGVSSVRTHDSIDSAHILYDSGTDYADTMLVVTSFESVDNISQKLNITSLPKDDGVLVSFAYAKKMGWEIGDEYTFIYGGNEFKGEIVGYADYSIAMVVIDADYYKIPRNLLVVKGKNNLPKETVREIVLESTTTENVVILKNDGEVFTDGMGKFSTYILTFICYSFLL